jgi:hypothetical protein
MRLAVRQTLYAPFNHLAFAIECLERLIGSKLFSGIPTVTDVSTLIAGPDKYYDACVITAPPMLFSESGVVINSPSIPASVNCWQANWDTPMVSTIKFRP